MAFRPTTQLPAKLPDGAHRVISEMTSAKMRMMMQGIVTEGTGKLAALNGYTSAGKDVHGAKNRRRHPHLLAHQTGRELCRLRSGLKPRHLGHRRDRQPDSRRQQVRRRRQRSSLRRGGAAGARVPRRPPRSTAQIHQGAPRRTAHRRAQRGPLRQHRRPERNVRRHQQPARRRSAPHPKPRRQPPPDLIGLSYPNRPTRSGRRRRPPTASHRTGPDSAPDRLSSRQPQLPTAPAPDGSAPPIYNLPAPTRQRPSGVPRSRRHRLHNRRHQPQ